MSLLLRHLHDHADDKQIVRIGKETHSGDEHDLLVGLGNGCFDELAEQIGVVLDRRKIVH